MEIIVLHEYGEKTHYASLEYLCKQYNIDLKYYEFSFLKNFIKSIIKLDSNLFKKQISNFKFLISLWFTKNKKIILGMAPYDYRLFFLRYFFKKHNIYYHTSWTKWDRTFYPKKRFVNFKLFFLWEKFLKYEIKYIFSVSNYTKQSLIKNLSINDEDISVVYHSLNSRIFYYKNLEKTNDFIYAGRLVKEKGIKELIEIFSQKKERLIIVGDGVLKDFVKSQAKLYDNIIYMNKVSQDELSHLFNISKFLILNSKKSSFWEELFGMVIIEAMACGVIPVVVNHSGPKEILDNEIGFLYEEEDLSGVLKKISNINESEILTKCIEKSQFFTINNIAKLWKKVIE